jgi:hypothetical protein
VRSLPRRDGGVGSEYERAFRRAEDLVRTKAQTSADEEIKAMLSGIRSRFDFAKTVLIGGGLGLLGLAGSAAPGLVPAAAAYTPDPNSYCYQLGYSRMNAIQTAHVEFFMDDRQNAHLNIMWANELLRRAQAAQCAGSEDLQLESDPYYW